MDGQAVAGRMKAVVIPVTPFQQNCSILWDEATMKAAVVDPGGGVDTILKVIAEKGLTVEKILVTHGHVDHAAGVADLKDRLGVPVEGPHNADGFLIQALPMQGQGYGMGYARAFTPDRWLDQGDTVTLGSLEFQVLHCPGHTPGHVVFFHAPSRFAVVGDVIFKGSIGRTDFPGGDYDTLIASIRERLFALGDDVTVLPGHGETTTLGWERRTNPFCSDQAVAQA